MINWNKINKEDYETIYKITKRANVHKNLDNLDMDIAATHISNPLRLKEMLNSDNFNFWHDINGIVANLNRKTGKLENCFLPRFSKLRKN
jgi:hypothetical protein